MFEPEDKVNNQKDDKNKNKNKMESALKDLIERYSALDTKMQNIMDINNKYAKELKDSQNTIKELQNQLQEAKKQAPNSISDKQINLLQEQQTKFLQTLDAKHTQRMDLMETNHDALTSQHNYTLLCTFLTASIAAAAIALCVSKHNNK